LPSRKLIIAPQPTPAWPADSPARGRAVIGQWGQGCDLGGSEPGRQGKGRKSLPSVDGDDADSARWARSEAGRDGWVRVGGPLARPGDDPLSHPLVGQYPGRGAVSRPSSEWGRVGPARCGHQVGPGIRRPRGAAEIRGQRSEVRDQTAPSVQRRHRFGGGRRDSVRADLEIGPTAPTRQRRRRGGALVLQVVKLGAWVAEIRCRWSVVRWQRTRPRGRRCSVIWHLTSDL
jgi:hypothetical protein